MAAPKSPSQSPASPGSAPMRIQTEALTFDDVLLQPAYSDVLPRQVNLKKIGRAHV